MNSMMFPAGQGRLSGVTTDLGLRVDGGGLHISNPPEPEFWVMEDPPPGVPRPGDPRVRPEAPPVAPRLDDPRTRPTDVTPVDATPPDIHATPPQPTAPPAAREPARVPWLMIAAGVGLVAYAAYVTGRLRRGA